MLATEPEAQQRICPQSIGSPDGAGCCAGPRCMAWTWAQREFQFYEGPTHLGLPSHVGSTDAWEVMRQYDKPQIKHLGFGGYTDVMASWTKWRRVHPPGTRQGYCGMAMRPVVSKLNRQDNMGALTDGR